MRIEYPLLLLIGFLLHPSLVMGEDLAFSLPAKSERLAFSKKVQDIFWRFDFQYEKYKTHGEAGEWDLACEYAKRSYQILVNNYSELDKSIPKGGWGARRTSLKRTVDACGRE